MNQPPPNFFFTVTLFYNLSRFPPKKKNDG